MEKILFAIILSAVAVGCASKVSSVEENAPEIAACFEGAPEWAISGAAEGGLSAVGMAKIGKAGINFARTEALANGRDEIARILSIKVNNMFKNFTQTTGIGDEETVDRVAASVSKQVASQMISGSKQFASWVSPCNELYILVAVDTQIAQEAVISQSVSSFKNNEALWQQYVAEKGQEELEKAVKELF
ncbi:MAG: LPP20 family lipoprotein [Clostridia bacterium]|nr:LPP20 family lipoprotein [Clostridia bacterium]